MFTSEKRLEVRLASSSDFHPVVSFLERNKAGSLPLPGAQFLKEALARSTMYVAEVDGGLAACAGLFSTCEGTDHAGVAGPVATPEVDVSELAAAFVAGDAGGLTPDSLHGLLMSLRLIGALVANDAERPLCFLSATLESASTSRANLLDNGFVEVTDPPRWLVLEQRTWALELGVRYFVLPSSAVAHHASRVLRSIESGACLTRDDRKCPGGIERFMLSVSATWLDWGVDAVRALAGGLPASNVHALPPHRVFEDGDWI